MYFFVIRVVLLKDMNTVSSSWFAFNICSRVVSVHIFSVLSNLFYI